MDELEELLFNSLAKAEKANGFSQIGTMQDPSLSQLKEQIKNIMLPLLLKIFQLKIHVNQEIIIDTQTSTGDDEESSIQKLKLLDNDLKMLIRWCQTCIKQMQEVMNLNRENSRFKTLYTDPQNHFNKCWWHKFYKKFHNKSPEI